MLRQAEQAHRAPVLLAVVLALLPAPAAAMHLEAPTAARITAGESHGHPFTRSWGSYFAFTSADNLSGEGTVGRQVFVFSHRDYVCQLGRPELQSPWEVQPPCPVVPAAYLRQVTSGPGDPQSASVNVDGTIVAFEALGSFGGGTGPSASRRQIFVKNLVTGVVTRVTDSPHGDSVRPSLNEAGGSVVFESTAPLLGGRAGISQIFVYHVATGRLIQITNGDGPSLHPIMNRLGDHVAFQSTAALVQPFPGGAGEGPDTGVAQIYWWDRPSGSLHKLTNGNAPSQHPYIMEKAPGLIFFDSAATDFPGRIGGGTQIFAASTRDGDLPVPFQYTYGEGDCTHPAVEPNGTRVAFVCTGDLLQNGTRGRRLFALDFAEAANVLWQITGRHEVDVPIGTSLGRWFVTAASRGDLAGTGICGQQLFVLNFNPDHYFEPGHARKPATHPGRLPVEPDDGNPHDSCDDRNGCTSDACDAGICVHGTEPDGTVCGGDTDPMTCLQPATCQAGACVPALTPHCDDGDPCTVDECLPNGECQVTTPAPIDALECRLRQLEAAVSKVRLRRAQQIRFRRVQRLVRRVRGAPLRRQMRSLERSAQNLDAFARLLRADRRFTSDRLAELVTPADRLRTQIATVLHEVKTLLALNQRRSGRGGRGR